MATPTDSDLGKIYVGRHKQDTMFSRGTWYKYKDGVWSEVHELKIIKEFWFLAMQHQQDGVRPAMKIISSLRSFVKSHLFVPEDEVDAYSNLINLLNGVYNIEDGNLSPHKPEYRFTTQLPFGCDPKAPSSMWQMYLMSTFVKPRTTDFDPELAEFVQEAIGYSLTTDISHHVMFWCFGTGANGKGVLFHVLEQLGGSSVTPLNIGLLRREPYQLASLAGKRIGLCSEASATDNLVDDAQVKAIVGGDTMPARGIYQKPFILHPTVKLWWAMNQLPAIADTSEGFWRKVRVIPFNRQFKEDERILDLKDKLDLELPGIFNWAMKGQRRLRKQRGFTIPKQVDETTKTYRTDSNAIALFVKDECIEHETYEVQSSTIYHEYKEWCKRNTYKPFSSRNFKREMEQLGFYHKRKNAYSVYEGLKLNPNTLP